jgi:hypothetical protein
MTAITLIGCTEPKANDTAACEQQTLRFFSDATGDNFMVACMEAKGYRFDVEPTECDSKTRMAVQPSCYTPQGWLSEIIDSWERSPAKKAHVAR